MSSGRTVAEVRCLQYGALTAAIGGALVIVLPLVLWDHDIGLARLSFIVCSVPTVVLFMIFFVKYEMIQQRG